MGMHMANLDIENACSTSRNEAVGTTSLEAASCNLSHLDRISNSTELNSTNRVNRSVRTIAGLSADFRSAIASSSATPLGDGNYAVGRIYTQYNQYLIDSGVPYKLKVSTSVPYTTTEANAANDDNLEPYRVVEGESPILVKSIAEIQSANVGNGNALYLSLGGRSGHFQWRVGTFTDELALDTQNGIFIASSSNTTGAWVRNYENFDNIPAEWFGAVGDGSTDSTSAIQNALEFSARYRKPAWLSQGEYRHTGLTQKTDSSLQGAGRFLTRLRILPNSNADSIRLFNPTQIRPSVIGLTIIGLKEMNTTGHGINYTSQLATAAVDGALRARIIDVEVRECAQDGIRIDAPTGFVNSVENEISDSLTAYNVNKGLRLGRCTDGIVSRVICLGNDEEGFFATSMANFKVLSCKTFLNAENNNGRGWGMSGGSRNMFVACEAQEDFQIGFSFFQEIDSNISVIADANGTTSSPGTGVRLANCTDCQIEVTSTSFQNPTKQGAAMSLSNNQRLDIRVNNNDARVANIATVLGTTNDDVYIRRNGSARVLETGSSTLRELNNFEEGTFTPSIDFGSATSGDLVVTYTTRQGRYTRSQGSVTIHYEIVATMTHTTATGNLFVRGLPINVDTTVRCIGDVLTSGVGDNITGLLKISNTIASGNVMSFFASRVNAGITTVNHTNVPTGTQVHIIGSLTYFASY